MSDMTELFNDYTRSRTLEDKVVVDVQVIRWLSSYEPQGVWVPVFELSCGAGTAAITEARNKLLAMPRYFQTCDCCQQLMAVGHMHDDGVCQGCAEKHLGVAY